jgi:hypothetical protein
MDYQEPADYKDPDRRPGDPRPGDILRNFYPSAKWGRPRPRGGGVGARIARTWRRLTSRAPNP